MYQIINYYQENNQIITDFKLKSRYLWNDHITYTRNAIISIIAGLDDKDDISIRLLKNQEDIGYFISNYYTDSQISRFVNLLKEHIIIAVDVISGVENSETRWRLNGNELVMYMSQMNPSFWSTDIIWPLWSTHMDLTISQSNNRKNQLWSDDIAAYDDNHQCMSEFSDVFSGGIIYQNMDMFCYNPRIM